MTQDVFAFQAIQHQFTACIRQPEKNLPPSSVKLERMQVYQELFYNSMEDFLSTGFPVLHSLYTETAWHDLVRDFFICHACRTPYFNEIGQEFLSFLQTERLPRPDDLPFLLELAHYEWIELALAISELEWPQQGFDAQGDLLSGVPVLSPLAWLLSYHFPVHRIGLEFQPAAPSEEVTCLVLYRTEDFAVKPLEINAMTFHCLTLLKDQPDWTGQQIFLHLAELTQHPRPEVVIDGGLQILENLRELGIILGTRKN